jgi:hypothetical protein
MRRAVVCFYLGSLSIEAPVGAAAVRFFDECKCKKLRDDLLSLVLRENVCFVVLQGEA